MKKFKLYNGDVIILFDGDNGKHAYYLEENNKKKRLCGVTTYCGIINKPFLLKWAVDTTVDYIRDRLEILQAGFISGNDILEMARQESDKIKTDSADLGRAIHKWVEDYIMGKKPEMPTDERIIIGINSFLDWEKEHKVKYLWTEKVVYSREYGFVGTADIGIMINKKMYLVDIKTGNSLYPEVKLQTAGYVGALEEELGVKFAGRWAIRLSKESEEDYYERMEKKKTKTIPSYKIFEAVFLDHDEDELDRDYKSFLNALSLYEWQKSADKIFRALK